MEKTYLISEKLLVSYMAAAVAAYDKVKYKHAPKKKELKEIVMMCKLVVRAERQQEELSNDLVK